MQKRRGLSLSLKNYLFIIFNMCTLFMIGCYDTRAKTIGIQAS